MTNTAVTNLPPVQTFQNVTMFRQGEMVGGISEIACKSLKIEVLPYAQYPAAMRVTFLPKGKRLQRQTWIFGNTPFLVVLPTDKAANINPSYYLPAESSTPGVTVRRGKYGSCDPRWVSDFTASLSASGVEPLVFVDGASL